MNKLKHQMVKLFFFRKSNGETCIQVFGSTLEFFFSSLFKFGEKVIINI